jgi:N-acetylglucosaminyl-diphospho-decaprenol L-rhamnosyltransferase
MITVSIVSHKQFNQVLNCIESFERHSKTKFFYIITINISESFSENNLRKITKNYKIIINEKPLGFGTNHNNASKEVVCNTFIVCNPDIDVVNFDIEKFDSYESKNQFLAPQVQIGGNAGNYYDFRDFPSFFNILNRQYRKLILRSQSNQKENHFLKYSWFPGYFMIFDIKIFKSIGGFDSNFFMYCEDVDLCLRIKKQKQKINLSNNIKVNHIGQFSSNKKPKYFIMHIISLLKLNFRMYRGYY